MRLVGVDFGSSSLKVVYAQKSGRATRVLASGIIDLAHQRISSQEDLVNLLREKVEEMGLRGRRAFTMVSHQNTVIKFLRAPQVPRLRAYELIEMVKWEIDPSLSFPLDETVFDFMRYGTTMTEQGDKTLLLLGAAVQRDVMDNQIGILRSVGLRPAGIGIIPLALTTAYANKQPSDIFAIVDIGAQTTGINIIRGGHLDFSRNIPIAGKHFTDVIRQKLRVEAEEAEQLKREFRTLVADKTQEEIDADPQLSQLSRCVSLCMTDLLARIQRTFDYFKTMTRQFDIPHVLLCGGGSMMYQIEGFLSRGLKTDVKVVNPLDDINFVSGGEQAAELREIGPVLAVAYGLSQGDKFARINFRHPKFRGRPKGPGIALRLRKVSQRSKTAWQNAVNYITTVLWPGTKSALSKTIDVIPIIPIGVAVLNVLFLGLSYWEYKSQQSHREDLVRLNNEIKAKDNLIQAFTNLVANRDSARDKRDQARKRFFEQVKVLGLPKARTEFMFKLGDACPPGLWLTAVDYQEDTNTPGTDSVRATIVLEGAVSAESKEAQVAKIEEFKANLERTREFFALYEDAEPNPTAGKYNRLVRTFSIRIESEFEVERSTS